MNDPLLPATLNQNGAYPPNGVIDVWQQGGGALGAPAPQSEVAPLKVVHRSLRGRYPLAITLAVAGAVVAGMIGWNSKAPTYRARGVAKIEPVLTNFNDTKGDQIPFYRDYMLTQASEFRSLTLADRAMSDDVWQKNNGSDLSPGAKAAFLTNLRATYPNSGFNLEVSFESPDPKLAVAGVNAALNGYEKIRKDSSEGNVAERQAFLDNKGKELKTNIDRAEARILEITKPWLTDDLSEVMKNNQNEIAKLNADIALLETRLATYRAAMNAAHGNTKVTLDDLAGNPQVANLLERRAAVDFNLIRIQGAGSLGSNSPAVLHAKDDLAAIDKQLENFRLAAQNTQNGIVYDANGLLIQVRPQLVESVSQAIDQLKVNLAKTTENAAKAFDASLQVRGQRTEMNQFRDQLTANEARIEGLRSRGLTTAAPMTISPAFAAEPANDRRMTTAMVFGFGGAVVPVAALFLLGLADRRVRYSDDTSAGSKGVALLGILPNLPDRLSDPSQASVAAHCVHHIRSMLQLNAMGDEPAAITITSASSADGKTSLSLALGLSFAASGSRTLLIDTDLVGAGLSARLGVSDSTGILEALAARDPMTCVRETDVQDLSILPMGSNAVNNAGAFSPATMKRLISEAKKHFDTILIDTGPLLGSIEATPVCNASDAVILCVSRGQNRGLVERAIGHLRSINARLAGLVFNRAATADFERSISGISLRSASRSQANGHNAAYSNGNGDLVGSGDRMR